MKTAKFVLPFMLLATLPAGMGCALAAQELGSDRARSPGAALALSVVGTALPIAISLRGNDAAHYALLAGGLVLGPALGHVYAGEAWDGMANAGIRVAVLGVSFGAALLIRDPADDRKHLGVLVPLVLGGVLATTVLAVRDLARVDDHLRVRSEALSAPMEAAGLVQGGEMGHGIAAADVG